MSTLAELRKANLQEQKDQEAAKSEDPKVEISLPEAKALEPDPERETPVLPSIRDHDMRQSARIAEILTGATTASPTLTLETVIASESDQFLTRLRETLSHKTLYPTGTKVTVDMAPALFHRAKRYCLDHGNITLRQVFLDLLNEFLDEEGY